MFITLVSLSKQSDPPSTELCLTLLTIEIKIAGKHTDGRKDKGHGGEMDHPLAGEVRTRMAYYFGYFGTCSG